MTSNAQKRVAIDKAVFGHRVVASLTGNTMSTPDTHKPNLVEVAVMRSDNDLGHVWVPVEATSTLTYEVSIQFHQEDFESPTDAVLGMIAHLRHAEPGDLTFNVRCVEDNVTYTVDAGMGQGEWDAYVTEAASPNPQNEKLMVRRDDLVPYRSASPEPDPDEALIDLVLARHGGLTEPTPHTVASILRETGRPLGDADVLRIHKKITARQKG